MLTAIISDIHSNLEATLAVIKKIKEIGVEKIICLGDIIGYCANPNECCEIIKEKAAVVIMGNHESGVIGQTPLNWFSDDAKDTCIWTAKNLEQKYFVWIKNFKLTYTMDEFFFVHASPYSPEKWNYITTFGDAIKGFEFFNSKVCFVGHSHVQFAIVKKNGGYEKIEDNRFTLENNAKYIINPGSVGQPRDFDPRASFIIYDERKKEFEFIRVEYDIKSAQKKILSANLPPFLAYRLSLGK